jgi:cytochrome b561
VTASRRHLVIEMNKNMQQDTQEYGSFAKGLHWSIAALILASYVVVYCAAWFTEERTPGWVFLVRSHQAIGLTVGVLTVVRLLWRLNTTQPAPEPASAVQQMSARAVHWLLYILLLIMPLTGWIGANGDLQFGSITIPAFRHTPVYDLFVTRGLGVDWKTFERPIDAFHKDIVGPLILWPLVFVHIGAALYHHFVLRDRTLSRMTY